MYTDTALSQAIFELLNDLEQLIAEKAISLGLTEPLRDGAVKAYIYGGCAIHIYTNARGSNDLDAVLDGAKLLDLQSLVVELDPVYFEDTETNDESSLYWDDSFSTGIASITPDFRENAVQIGKFDGILHTYLISAVQIAVSKLSRLATDDLSDILSLYKKGLFTLEEFSEQAEEAILYSATEASLRLNVDHAITIMKELEANEDTESIQ
ncbi:conserved hypothetical protein [Vibrio crassostreae]|jgi:hypothetical protein|uniref:DUF6036 family nucleotidyltransferase n=1 Tax=Vibrio TaxID=662 RepID=UPI0005E0B7D2|nr:MULTISPECIES: DUF6036 family nucleotidyltransferase [Vibrio]KPL98291.1 hypothetical protein AN167_18905 [Vibrio splendidus]MCF7506260.1 hypothetical protein [Vibrio sp. L3-7]NOI51887.1 hypothetical protein [Vibrio crassostreae]TCT63372.1 hypothetical protein EDB44_106119 [Vibrio crassostreae]TCT84147.1 hypothetical protein EDB43_10689 [Vibrio crassostreae]